MAAIILIDNEITTTVNRIAPITTTGRRTNDGSAPRVIDIEIEGGMSVDPAAEQEKQPEEYQNWKNVQE